MWNKNDSTAYALAVAYRPKMSNWIVTCCNVFGDGTKPPEAGRFAVCRRAEVTLRMAKSRPIHRGDVFEGDSQNSLYYAIVSVDFMSTWKFRQAIPPPETLLGELYLYFGN
jgi:hypothetical protein